MPIYEYQCRSCGHEFETIQKVSDEALQECPACGLPELSKLVSAAGFRLKGGGWYETDFKGGNEKKRNLVGSGEAKETPASAEKSGAPTAKPSSSTAAKASGTDS